jgi:hypothetical protein
MNFKAFYLSKKLNFLLKIIFYGLILFQAMVVLSVPLIPSMNDSGWYYMNVHFIKTGNYVCESMYPSFQQPSQYYPFLGYSFFLYCCEKTAQLFHSDWSNLVKISQFCFYILSAFILKKLTIIQTAQKNLSYVVATLYLLYYPNFNYVNFVMSETYASFLILLLIYLFAKVNRRFKPWTAALMFLIAGYCVLVKPVFLPVSVFILFLFSLQCFRNKKYSRLTCILAVFIFPSAQSVFSKIKYDNYTIQSGMGWHLWDRVIQSDKLVPENSASLEKLKEIHALHHKSVNYGFWWDVTRDLSSFGYTEVESQKICKNVALDGIRENPGSYFLNTIGNSVRTFLIPVSSGDVYNTYSGYYQKVNDFSFEPQHVPLTDQLSRQNCFRYPVSRFQEYMLGINYRISILFNSAVGLFHNWLILGLYLLAGIFSLFLVVQKRMIENSLFFLVWFTSFAIIFCSCMLEYVQPRLMMPAFGCILLSIVFFIHQIIRILEGKAHEGKN